MTAFAAARAMAHTLVLDIRFLRDLPDGGDRVAMRLVRGALFATYENVQWGTA